MSEKIKMQKNSEVPGVLRRKKGEGTETTYCDGLWKEPFLGLDSIIDKIPIMKDMLTLLKSLSISL